MSRDISADVARRFLCSILGVSAILALTLTSSLSSAQTLKSLAIHSSALLALSDHESLQKKCRISADEISILSQKLKMQTDQKIEKLTERDFEIIKGRTSSCQRDCTCAIYSYALEQRGLKNVELERLAATETAADRKKCADQIKNFCSFVKK